MIHFLVPLSNKDRGGAGFHPSWHRVQLAFSRHKIRLRTDFLFSDTHFTSLKMYTQGSVDEHYPPEEDGTAAKPLGTHSVT